MYGVSDIPPNMPPNPNHKPNSNFNPNPNTNPTNLHAYIISSRRNVTTLLLPGCVRRSNSLCYSPQQIELFGLMTASLQ